MNLKNLTGNLKRRPRRRWNLAFVSAQFALLLSGCVGFQVGGEIQQGRQELMYGDPKVALAHFQRAAELDPDYRLNYSLFPEGVWTYVGRAYYLTGSLPEARKALERAVMQKDDNVARLYLGLVLAREGDRERGVREMETGLKGINDWYDYMQYNHYEGRFWDPGLYLRKAIQKQLASLRTSDLSTQELTQNVAYLGREVEIEIDRAKDTKITILYRDGGDDHRP